MNHIINIKVNKENTNKTNNKIIIDNENVIDNENMINNEDNEASYNFSLYVGYKFQNWNNVDSYFEAYGRYNRFSVIKKRVECKDGVIKYQSLGFTTFINEHNHELHPEACKYSANFWSIEKDVLNDIEFYIKKENLSIFIQCQLLKAKYPNIIFLDMDFVNTIRCFKSKSQELKSDASHFFSFLTKKQSEKSS
ncbi:2698_t:CDS:2 [Cetraspora pellucida]|uniref:2698_t:CDS:1 n=1 Tax=Cetraspora pellucida TaxID=1433469 RepID=A0ACA9NLW6_9GLOM|nr:2698_t:CDS:2 [Cetraspora pellucida]